MREDVEVYAEQVTALADVLKEFYESQPVGSPKITESMVSAAFYEVNSGHCIKDDPLGEAAVNLCEKIGRNPFDLVKNEVPDPFCNDVIPPLVPQWVVAYRLLYWSRLEES